MPVQLTADCFSNLRLCWGAVAQPEDMPAAIEHIFAAGRMVDHYFVLPTPTLWTNPQMPSRSEISGIVFMEQEGTAPWLVSLLRPDNSVSVRAEMSRAEFSRMLEKSHVVLPGSQGFVPPKTAS